MPYSVRREKGVLVGEENPTRWQRNYSSDSNEVWEWDITIIKVVADTYSELIEGIDQIPDKSLVWYSSRGSFGIEGRPEKSKGKWRAKLRTIVPKKNRGRPHPCGRNDVCKFCR